jgi:hypothetical protein
MPFLRGHYCSEMGNPSLCAREMAFCKVCFPLSRKIGGVRCVDSEMAQPGPTGKTHFPDLNMNERSAFEASFRPHAQKTDTVFAAALLRSLFESLNPSLPPLTPPTL